MPGLFNWKLSDGGLLILSRFPIVEWDFIVYSNSTYTDMASSKGVLYARLKIKDHYLNLFTTHIQAAYDNLGPHLKEIWLRIQVDQLRQLKDYMNLKMRGKDNEMALIAGDFNLNAFEELEYKIMKRILNFEVDFCRQYLGKSPVTVGAMKEDRTTPVETILTPLVNQGDEKCLDFIFQINKGKGLEPFNAFVEPMQIKGRNYPVTHLSDHFGIALELKYQEESSLASGKAESILKVQS